MFIFGRFPPLEHPVLAFRGAPASYPIQQRHVPLQQLLLWSTSIEDASNKYINEKLSPGKYVGIHLRNEDAWVSDLQISSLSVLELGPVVFDLFAKICILRPF